MLKIKIKRSFSRFQFQKQPFLKLKKPDREEE